MGSRCQKAAHHSAFSRAKTCVAGGDIGIAYHSVVGGQVEAEMEPFPCSGNDVKLGAISLTLKLVESRLNCALNLEREDCQDPKHISF